MSDPYVFDGTNVLINKFGIRDANQLSQLEREITSLKLACIPPDFDISEEGYRAVHRFIFEELYDWAGEYRSVTMAKGSNMFCLPLYIPEQMKKRFDLIRSDPDLLVSTPDIFASAAALHLNELNAIHPFREGNGRTMRLFLYQLAARAKLTFHISNIPGKEWIEVTIIGFRDQNNQPLAKVIAKTIQSVSPE